MGRLLHHVDCGRNAQQMSRMHKGRTYFDEKAQSTVSIRTSGVEFMTSKSDRHLG